MKPKNGKAVQPSQPGNIILDGQEEAVSPERFSWLKGALGLDEDTQARQAQALAAEIFLQSYLFPLIEQRERIDEQTLIDLLVYFKRSHTDLNTGFEVSQVSARLLHRFQCRLFDEADDPAPQGSDPLDREVLCLAALASLDFQRIDDSVRDQCRFG